MIIRFSNILRRAARPRAGVRPSGFPVVPKTPPPSVQTSTAANQPVPQQSAVDQTQVQQQSPSWMQTIGQAMVQGMGFSAGMRMMDGLFGPRQIDVTHTQDNSGQDQQPQQDVSNSSFDNNDSSGSDFSGDDFF